MMQKALRACRSATVRYYVDVLGFQINYQQEDLGVMDRDNITVLLGPCGVGPAAGSMYVYVRDADALTRSSKRRAPRWKASPSAIRGGCAISRLRTSTATISGSGSRLSNRQAGKDEVTSAEEK